MLIAISIAIVLSVCVVFVVLHSKEPVHTPKPGTNDLGLSPSPPSLHIHLSIYPIRVASLANLSTLSVY